jgi:membrane-associated phospholipid phosphatase
VDGQSNWVDRLRNRYQGVRFEWMDRVILVYLAGLGLLVVPFHHDVRHWPSVPAVHALLCLLIAELVRLNGRVRNPVLDFIRTFYPVLWISFAWSEMDNLVTMIFPYWANAWVVGLDVKLFGVHPTVWVQQWFRPWLTELMNFFYCIYYCFPAMVTFPLYFRGRRRETFEYLFLVVFTFAVSFTLFLIFPAEGAWVVLKDLHTVQPTGGFFLHFIQWLQAHGTMRGGAFPSSHVAAAVVMALGGLRYNRRVGIVLVPLALGVALATVYCRYHHAVDAIAGIASGLLLYAAGTGLLKAARRP